MHDDDTGYDAAQERRADEREQDMREAGTFPYNVLPTDMTLSGHPRPKMSDVEHAVRGLGISSLPRALPAGPVPMVLDTDENGDLRGAIAQAEDMTSLEADDDPSLLDAYEHTDEIRFGDPERAPPDPDDEAVIRHATETVERPAPLLPAAELFFAAACKVVNLVRADTSSPNGLDGALRAARLVRGLAVALEERLEAARHLRDRQWPKECRCGRVISREQWLELASHGVQKDPTGDLELKQCSSCGSTLAMPVAP